MLRPRDERHRDELRIRASQQAAVAELGQQALGGLLLEALMDAAARAAHEELATDYASVVELTGDGRGLLVRAGSGFPEGLVGGVLPAGPDALLGYALQAEQPVVVEDLAVESRFGPSPEQRRPRGDQRDGGPHRRARLPLRRDRRPQPHAAPLLRR